jgi:HEAT repeat protein
MLKIIFYISFIVTLTVSNTYALPPDSQDTDKTSPIQTKYGPKIPKEDILENIPRGLKREIMRLYSPDVSERVYALSMLGELGDEAKPAVPFIIGMLDDFTIIPVFFPGVQAVTAPAVIAAEALGNIGDKRAIEPLFNLLAHEYDEFAYGAAEALEKLDPEWMESDAVEQAVIHFINVLINEKDLEKGSNIYDRFSKIKVPIDRLVKLFKKREGKEKGYILSMLNRRSAEWIESETAKELKPEFIKMLKDEYPRGSFSASAILAKMGWEPEDEKEKIDFFISIGNIERLIEIGEPAIEPLIALSKKEKKVNVFIFRVKLLDKIDPAWIERSSAKEAVSYLVEALGDREHPRWAYNLGNITKALDKIEPKWKEREDAKKIADDYIHLLNDETAKDVMDRETLIGAIRILGIMKDKRAVEPMHAILNRYFFSINSNLERLSEMGHEGAIGSIRNSAIKALEKMGDPSAVDYIIDKLKSSYRPDMRGYIKEELDKLGWKPRDSYEEMVLLIVLDDKEKLPELDETAIEPLKKIIMSKGRFIFRARAAKMLDGLGWVPENDEEKIAYLISLNKVTKLFDMGEPAIVPFISYVSETRAMFKGKGLDAALFVSKAGAKVVDLLIPLLKNQSQDVRIFAIEALARIGDARAIEPLAALLTDKSILVTESGHGHKTYDSAADALVMFQDDPGIIETLLNVLGSEIVYASDEAAKLLGKAGEPAIEPLIDALESDNLNKVKGAVKALGKTGDKRAVEPLIGALKHEFYLIRYNAIKALGNIGDKRAIEPLIDILNVTSPLKKAGVVKELKKIDPSWVKSEKAKILVPGLIEDLDEYSEKVRRSSFRLLGMIGDKRAVEPLIELLYNKKSNIRLEALSALGAIGDIRAIEPIKKF